MRSVTLTNEFCIFANKDLLVKMEIVLLQINNDKAYKLLGDLEDMAQGLNSILADAAFPNRQVNNNI
jgi:hypothetical protein